jgi:hypothetical protein
MGPKAVNGLIEISGGQFDLNPRLLQRLTRPVKRLSGVQYRLFAGVKFGGL